MKQYPSILYETHIGEPCIAFYKYDGSNLRWEWSRKLGWNKFGTRHRLFDKTDKVFGVAIDIFMNSYAIDIEKVLRTNHNYRSCESAIAFTEFFGPNSFAGHHKINDKKELILFDICIHKKGLLGPREFIESFGHLKVAEVVYEGSFNKQFIQSIHDSSFPISLNEGVVAKGGSGHDLWMAKVKTGKYLAKLKRSFTDWEKYT